MMQAPSGRLLRDSWLSLSAADEEESAEQISLSVKKLGIGAKIKL